VAAPARGRWSKQVAFISAKMKLFFAAKSKRVRVQILRSIFQECLENPGMLACAPNFRRAVENKMVEFRAEPLMACLLRLFDQMDTMLATLRARPGYVA
jgi:hypothetical protein